VHRAEDRDQLERLAASGNLEHVLQTTARKRAEKETMEAAPPEVAPAPEREITPASAPFSLSACHAI
jgi:hypothetical protein